MTVEKEHDLMLEYIVEMAYITKRAVKRYILEQQGKDVFECSIFGDALGQSTKIGDFTQSKIDNFGGD